MLKGPATLILSRSVLVMGLGESATHEKIRDIVDGPKRERARRTG